ncbi:MAG: hypothetical protein ACO3L7_01200 [Poseidonia sp.]
MSVTLNGLIFARVEAATTVLGTTKGGWVYASQRPCYEAKLPSFFVMNNPLTERNVAVALGLPSADDKPDEAMEALTSDDLNELASQVMAGEDFRAFTAQQDGPWEVRALSESEWKTATSQNRVHLRPGLTERLCDAPASNNRGAMMDGRPRPNEVLGPASHQVAAMAVHPKNAEVTAITSVPRERPLPNVVARLALTPLRQGPPKRVPEATDRWSNVRAELLWTTVLGIVPSFLIPVLRGMSGYAVDGWVNLLFGGLCAGFLTGAIWRPKRPMLRYDDVS